MIMGALTWSFSEYFLHRFVFHGEQTWVPDTPFMIAFHFFINGNHHAYPQDPLRLTFPFIPACAVLYLFGGLPLSYVVPQAYYYVFMAGWLTTYVAYEMIHYFTHFGSTQSKFWSFIKKNHIDHHYRNANQGYGISSPLFDWVFRSGIKL
uniref:Fatty acid hydroxylase domain-containing protein n=1 Tax=Strombidium rassoulzadegani TaxID=1082188 RepID=A0A7S3CL64_9SPIT|mmetsp:Transcript_13203/g.22395  ORF Transcript_13203/g.22395 Transcript_13203/m.22395 type:complete len:150 (+) Transcript_13203:659-1108(+)